MGRDLETQPATARPSGVRRSDGWRLTVVHSPDPKVIGMQAVLDRPLVVGREGDAPFGQIDDRRLSRRHATLSPEGEHVIITDNDSRNGVFVAATKVRACTLDKPRAVRFGDTVLVVEPSRHAEVAERPASAALIGSSPAFAEACSKAHLAAESGLPALLLGETGVGKELFARAIHEWSLRSGRFVALNMAALPADLCESQLFGHVRGAFTGAHRDEDGAFATADRGTLLLDEIGELPAYLQPKLLRALEAREIAAIGATRTRTVDVAVVAATNADLGREVEAGSFRRDLFARLAGVVIRIPPLRARLTDIPSLMRHFLPGTSWSAAFIETALSHAWPMNVRELGTVCARLKLLGHSVLEREHLSALLAELSPVLPASEKVPAASEPPPGTRKKKPPRAELEAILERLHGNIAHTAKHYGCAVKQIYRWVEKDRIDLSRFRAPGSD